MRKQKAYLFTSFHSEQIWKTKFERVINLRRLLSILEGTVLCQGKTSAPCHRFLKLLGLFCGKLLLCVKINVALTFTFYSIQCKWILLRGECHLLTKVQFVQPNVKLVTHFLLTKNGQLKQSVKHNLHPVFKQKIKNPQIEQYQEWIISQLT